MDSMALPERAPVIRWKYAFFALLSLTSGCASVFVAGGPSLDSIGGDLETSIGPQIEAGFQNDRDGRGLGGYLSLGLIGYPDSGDGDPILLGTMEARYRHLWGSEAQAIRPFFSLGAGAGFASVLAGSLTPSAGVLPVHGELGGQYKKGRTVVSLSVRERPALLVAGSVSFLNSLQVSFGVGWLDVGPG
jgi:hypothetical protein